MSYWDFWMFAEKVSICRESQPARNMPERDEFLIAKLSLDLKTTSFTWMFGQRTIFYLVRQVCKDLESSH